MRKTYNNKRIEAISARGRIDALSHLVIARRTLWENLPLRNFLTVFCRVSDRCFYHADNAWQMLEQNLEEFERFEPKFEVPQDAHVGTRDYDSKYEIEAFLTGVRTLHEWNLRGVSRKKNRNMLGCAFPKQPFVVDEINKAFEHSWNFFSQKAKNIRDDCVHINSGMTEYHGQNAVICRKSSQLHVAWPYLYKDAKGEYVEIISVFDEIQQSAIQLIQTVQEILFHFISVKYGPPTNSFISFWPKGRHPALIRAMLTPTGIEILRLGNPCMEVQ